MGGTGSGMAHDEADLRRSRALRARRLSTTEVLLRGVDPGWKEYELEVMRDKADNVVIVCSIENLDPMGVHTGDSITVAPAMTLTDREYQHCATCRSVSSARSGRERRLQHPVRGQPVDGSSRRHRDGSRVSLVSALASKATGFPIAKIVAKVAIGYTLDEIPNDITAEDAGQVRADARLRRGQGAALGVREVPRRRPHADHAHEVSGRDHGDRPQLHRGAAEGAASLESRTRCSTGALPRWPTKDALRESIRRTTAGATWLRTRCGRRHTRDALEATGIDPWFVDQLALTNGSPRTYRRARS